MSPLLPLALVLVKRLRTPLVIPHLNNENASGSDFPLRTGSGIGAAFTSQRQQPPDIDVLKVGAGSTTRAIAEGRIEIVCKILHIRASIAAAAIFFQDFFVLLLFSNIKLASPSRTVAWGP
jgi:hypothetical protein